jgi:hypothetical protein
MGLTNFEMKKITLALLAILALGVVGCNEETKASKNEEQAFRNPLKEPPAAAAEGMRKGMEAAAEAQKKAQAGTPK